MIYSFDDFVMFLVSYLSSDSPQAEIDEKVNRLLNAMLPEYRERALAEAKRQVGSIKSGGTQEQA